MKKKQQINESFFGKVYAVVYRIPYGRVTSYGAIAEHLGSKMSARMVGWAMNACHNHFPPVPAHRVVNRNGLLTGKNHFATPTLMQELLENEGIEVIDNQVQNFEKHFWKPGKELKTRNPKSEGRSKFKLKKLK